MSGPNGHQHAGTSRFQIASRLGGFRDTVRLSDPFGTGAVLTIRRKGSQANREWSTKYLEADPVSRSILEQQFLEDPIPVLTQEEQAQVLSAQKAAEGWTGESGIQKSLSTLLDIVDRLSTSKQESEGARRAVRRVIETGQVSLMDAISPSRQEAHRKLEEAIHLLSFWEGMPDADGSIIPYSPATCRELLTSDIPLEGAGLDDLLLTVDPWTLTINTAPEGEEPKETRILRSRLTLGTAYILWVHWVSERASHFRDLTLEAAGKNSPASSETSSSSGDATTEQTADSSLTAVS